MTLGAVAISGCFLLPKPPPHPCHFTILHKASLQFVERKDRSYVAISCICSSYSLMLIKTRVPKARPLISTKKTQGAYSPTSHQCCQTCSKAKCSAANRFSTGISGKCTTWSNLHFGLRLYGMFCLKSMIIPKEYHLYTYKIDCLLTAWISGILHSTVPFN